MNNIESKGKGKNITIIVLSMLLIIALGFICYDKFFIKEKTIKQDCKCSKCEKCNTEIEKAKQEEDKICELDMKDKNVLDVYDLCKNKGIANASRIKINNIQIDDQIHQLYYNHEKYCDTVDGCNNFKSSFNSITKVFIDDNLLDVYKGKNRQLLWTIRIDNSNLILSETWPSEAPPVDYTYDLKDLNSKS